MHFLITGGAGFLGSALANRLASQGHYVRVIDDLSAGDPARLDPAVSFVRGDITDVPKLWTLLQRIDCVYHLAARVSVSQSILYPREYNTVNVGGTVSVMEAMRDAGVKRVVFTSSGAVYGEQERKLVSESTTPNPSSPYAVSKLSAEYYIRTIGALWGIETVSLRVFNAYGPGQPIPPFHAPVIANFLRQAVRGGSLVVFGDGRQSRDYVYLSDVVDALIASATASGIDRQVINIGCGKETSVNELIMLIERVVGKHVEPLYNRSEKGGVSHLAADISLARQKLGYQPKVSLEEGIRRMLTQDPQFKAAP